MDSVLMMRDCARTVDFDNQILKGLNCISWYLSSIKSRMGGKFTLFDTFSF